MPKHKSLGPNSSSQSSNPFLVCTCYIHAPLQPEGICRIQLRGTGLLSLANQGTYGISAIMAIHSSQTAGFCFTHLAGSMCASSLAYPCCFCMCSCSLLLAALLICACYRFVCDIYPISCAGRWLFLLLPSRCFPFVLGHIPAAWLSNSATRPTQRRARRMRSPQRAPGHAPRRLGNRRKYNKASLLTQEPCQKHVATVLIL